MNPKTPNEPKQKHEAEHPPAAQPPLKDELYAGDLVDGKYQIIESIGVGGFGRVYKALHLSLSQIVALKAFHSAELSASALRRIGIEARAAGALEHKNLVRSRDFGVMSDNRPYIVMDYYEGKTLAHYVSDNGKLSLNQALDIFIQLCSGLAYAHNIGVVHRDIKPSNVLMAKDRDQPGGLSPKILDFGMAKVQVEMETQMLTLTQKGELIGTPLYMSPEQCNGEATDSRSDVYSMGCTLFEALTGSPPFMANSALEIMMKHNSSPLPSMKEASLGEEFPESIEYVLKKMTAKAPADRYQFFEKVVEDLKAIQRGDFQLRQAKAKDIAERNKKDPKPAAMVAIALAFSFAVGGAVGASWQAHSMHEPAGKLTGPSSYTVGTTLPHTLDDGEMANTLLPRRDIWERKTVLKEVPPDESLSGSNFILVTNTFPVVPEYFKSGKPEAVVFEHRDMPIKSYSDDQSFKSIDQVKSAKILCIRKTILAPTQLDRINIFSNLRWLQFLNFDSTPNVPYAAEWLARLNVYNSLLVFDVNNLESIKPLVDKLQPNHQLRRLSMSLLTATTPIPHQDIDEIFKHDTLEILALKNFVSAGTSENVTFMRLTGLSKMPHLKRLFLEERTAVENVDELQKCTSLRYLHVRPTAAETRNIEMLRKKLPSVQIVPDSKGMEIAKYFDPEAQEPSGLGIFGNE